MSAILISYSHADTTFVVKLRQRLVRCGHETWVDWTHIRETKEWVIQAQRGIEACRYFIFVATARSLASSCCATELDHALKHNKHVICVVPQPRLAPPAATWLHCCAIIDFAKPCRYPTSLHSLLTAGMLNCARRLLSSYCDISHYAESKRP